MPNVVAEENDIKIMKFQKERLLFALLLLYKTVWPLRKSRNEMLHPRAVLLDKVMKAFNRPHQRCCPQQVPLNVLK